MTTYTDYADDTTGNNLYAKPEPLDTSPWSDGVVTATENGSTGSYAFTLNSELSYVVYRRAGASPASTDLKLGRFPKNFELDIQSQTDLIGTQFSVEARRIVGSDIYAYVGSTADIGPITVLDEAGDPVTLTGMNLKFCIATKSEVTLAEYTPTISGSTFTVENVDASIRAVKRELLWSLRDTDDGDEPVTFGNLFIIFAAKRA